MRNLWLLTLLSAIPLRAEAGLCDSRDLGPVAGPVQASFGDGHLGVARDPCPRTELGVGLSAGLAADSFNYFGRLIAHVDVQGTVRLPGRFFLFGGWEFLRYEKVIAPLNASAVGLGTLAIGGGWRFLERDNGALAVTARGVLPTATGIYLGQVPFAWDAQLSAAGGPTPWLGFSASGGLRWSAMAGPGPDYPRAGALVRGGVELRAQDQFAFAAELRGAFGYDAPVDHLAAAFALRFSDMKRFRMEIGAALPFYGQEPLAVALTIDVGIRLGKLPTPAAATPIAPPQ